MAAQLIDWVEDALDKQFTTNAPEMLVVKGLLFLLGRLLTFESDRYQKLLDKRQKIYSYVRRVLHAQGVSAFVVLRLLLVGT